MPNEGTADTSSSTNTQRPTDSDLMIADIGGMFQETSTDKKEESSVSTEDTATKAAAEALAATKEEESNGEEAGEVDETALIRQRADYLKHKSKLAEREKQLKADQEALKASQKELDALKSEVLQIKADLAKPKEAKKEESDPLDVGFKPEDFEDEGSQYLAKAILQAKKVITDLQAEVKALKGESSQTAAASAEAQARFIVSTVDQGVAILKADPMVGPLEISSEDVAQAVLSQGKALAKKYGSLTPEMCAEAWKRENYEILLAAHVQKGGQGQQKAAGEEKPEALGSNTFRGATGAETDDDRMLLDLRGAG